MTPPVAKTATARPDVVGVALDGHLGAGDQRQLAERGDELIRRNQRRRATPDEHRLHGPGLAGERLGDVPPHGGEVVADQMVPVGPRGERGVVAPRAAERDVDVHAERDGHRRALTISTAAATAAVSTRSTLPPRATVEAADLQFLGRPTALRANGDPRVRPLHRPATGLGDGDLGQHLESRLRAGDLRKPHPARLHRGLGGDAAQPCQLPLESLTGPADDRVLGLQQDDPIDPDLGALGDEPLHAIALRRGDSDRQHRVRTLHRLHLAGHRDTVAGERRGPPMSSSVRDGHRLAATQAQHPRQGGAGPRCRAADRRCRRRARGRRSGGVPQSLRSPATQADVGARSLALARSHQRTGSSTYWNADLMRENRPLSSEPTVSPRSSAS